MPSSRGEFSFKTSIVFWDPELQQDKFEPDVDFQEGNEMNTVTCGLMYRNLLTKTC